MSDRGTQMFTDNLRRLAADQSDYNVRSSLVDCADIIDELRKARVGARTSASYEYEIDTLREALRRLCSYNDGTAECDAHFTCYDWQSAWEQARAAIERTDWRAP